MPGRWWSVVPLLVLVSPLCALFCLRGGESQGEVVQRMVLSEVNNRCATCHRAFVDEWSGSRHAKAFSGMTYQKAARLMGMRATQCDTCHAPGLVQTTGADQLPGFRQLANVPDRGVMCVCCHLDGDGAMHGPYGGKTEFHKTVKDDSFKTNAPCVACHGQTAGAGADYDQVTPFKTYEATAKGTTCATCHMPTVEREAATGSPRRKCGAHRWPGAYNQAMLARAATASLKVEGTSATVTVKNGTGHMMPGGAWRQCVLLILSDHQIVKREIFARTPGGWSDTRLKPTEQRVVTATVVAGAKVKAQLWWKPMPDTPENQSTLMSELTPG